MRILALFLMLTAGALAQAVGASVATNVPAGRCIITPFASAPFPDASRAQGHKYHEEFYSAATNYSDSTVALFIPLGFQPHRRVDFVVHFHGWRHTVAQTLKEYHLPELFAASGRNAILIVPQGPYNAPDSGGGKLEATNGFQRFMDEAITTLKKNGVCPADAVVGDIILSGHSGGYQVMARILDRGGLTDHIREVWLFDALYAFREDFLAWADGGPHRLLDIYTDHGGTKDESESLMATLRQRGRPLLATNDVAVTPEELATNHYVFLHSDLAHDEVIAKRKMFQQFLETSCLPPAKP